jgi:2-hydroxyacyl-CoA lyase 1
LPADLIQGKAAPGSQLPEPENVLIPPPPKSSGDPAHILKVAQMLRTARSPLVVIGKGAAYARAESKINQLVEQTQIPFLPTPMGKGVVPDSHPLNASSARSAALRNADVVLVLGARLNWILHFGEPPKWAPGAKIIQVDLCAEEIGRNAGAAELGIIGDIDLVVGQLLASLSSWKYAPSPPEGRFPALLADSAKKNEDKAQKAALTPTPRNRPMTYQRAYQIIKSALNTLSPFEEGNIVYVSEGANAMDISRSSFPLNHPRQRLDAGTYATMGVGMGYAIAAHEAYNTLPLSAGSKPKKIVALEGDSAFGFSGMEIETMARYRIPALIFVMNNSGIYHGDSSSEAAWRTLQDQTAANDTKPDAQDGRSRGLRSTSLLYETRYEHMATMCGGKGYFVRTEDELDAATREGFQNNTVTVVNVVVEPGIGKQIGFAWQGVKKEGQAKL